MFPFFPAPRAPPAAQQSMGNYDPRTEKPSGLFGAIASAFTVASTVPPTGGAAAPAAARSAFPDYNYSSNRPGAPGSLIAS